MYIQALEDKNICQDLAALCKFFALQESTSSVNHVPVNFYFNFLINSHLIWTYLYFTDEYTTGVWVNTGFILYSTSPFSFTFILSICLYSILFIYKKKLSAVSPAMQFFSLLPKAPFMFLVFFLLSSKLCYLPYSLIFHYAHILSNSIVT